MGSLLDKALQDSIAEMRHTLPALRGIAIRMVEAMFALDFPVTVFEATRSDTRQQQLYAKGRTEPGRIVTYTDGVVKKSQHQIQGDGFSHAVDIIFLDDAGRVTWDMHYPWDLLGAMGEALGVKWGGRFKTLRDLPHFEL